MVSNGFNYDMASLYYLMEIFNVVLSIWMVQLDVRDDFKSVLFYRIEILSESKNLEGGFLCMLDKADPTSDSLCKVIVLGGEGRGVEVML